MTQDEVYQLIPGTPVIWDNDASEQGKIISIMQRGIGIRWTDGVHTIIQVVFWKDLGHLSVWMPAHTN